MKHIKHDYAPEIQTHDFSFTMTSDMISEPSARKKSPKIQIDKHYDTIEVPQDGPADDPVAEEAKDDDADDAEE